MTVTVCLLQNSKFKVRLKRIIQDKIIVINLTKETGKQVSFPLVEGPLMEKEMKAKPEKKRLLGMGSRTRDWWRSPVTRAKPEKKRERVLGRGLSSEESPPRLRTESYNEAAALEIAVEGFSTLRCLKMNKVKKRNIQSWFNPLMTKVFCNFSRNLASF